MIQAKDFNLSMIQAIIFFPSFFKHQIIFDKILANWHNYFDAVPISIPTPPDIPAQIPRIILQSENRNYKMEIAPARVNLFWLRQKDEDEINPAEFLKVCTQIFSEYLNLTPVKVNRVAAHLNRFVMQNDPAVTLVGHFCDKKWLKAPLNRPENFELHAHKRYELAKYHVNSWVRCKTGFVSYDPERPIILVEQDLNTVVKEGAEFFAEDINSFYNLIVNEFDHILALYFPEEGKS